MTGCLLCAQAFYVRVVLVLLFFALNSLIIRLRNVCAQLTSMTSRFQSNWFFKILYKILSWWNPKSVDGSVPQKFSSWTIRKKINNTIEIYRIVNELCVCVCVCDWLWVVQCMSCLRWHREYLSFAIVWPKQTCWEFL